MRPSQKFRDTIVFAIGFSFAIALGVCARLLWLWPPLRTGGAVGVLLYMAVVFGIGMGFGWVMRLIAPRVSRWYDGRR